MSRCTFIACLVGDLESVRFFFQIAAPNNPEFFASPPRQTRDQQQVDRLLPPPSAEPAATTTNDDDADPSTPQQQFNNNNNNNNYYSPTNSIGESQNLEMILSDAAANVVLQETNGDIIEASFRGKNALPLCDVVILVCDSSNSPDSVQYVHQQVGRAGSNAAALPANPPILLFDLGNYDTDPSSQTAEYLDMLNDLEDVVRYVGSCYLDPEIAGRPGSALGVY